jgi:effector-binding domain-containing protein
MPGNPHSGSKVWKAADWEISKPGENRGKVIAHWEFQPAAAFHDRENRRNLRSCLWAADVQPATQSLNWINAALDELDKCQSPISVIVKRRPAVRIASIRVKLRNYAEVARFEKELSDALPPEFVGSLHGVLWHSCADSGSLEAEPFVELKKRAPLRGLCEMKELPEATLACAYSRTADESAEQAYLAVRRWMQIRGYRLAGPKREIYLQNMLEIQFPLDS